MSSDHFCPRCQQVIDPKRMESSPVVCGSCGFVLSNSHLQMVRDLENRFLKVAVAITSALVAGFVIFGSLGPHPFSRAYLQAKEGLGLNSPQARQRLAALCLQAKNYNCTEKMYLRLSQTDPQYVLELGKLQFEQQQYKQAAQTYHHYFLKGGKDLEAAYTYARTLGELGKVKQASHYYGLVLRKRGNDLQIAAARGYLDLLAKHGRRRQAQRLIASVRSKDKTVGEGLEREYKRQSH